MQHNNDIYNIGYKVPECKRWTQSAKDCYFLGCACFKCPVYEIIGNKCRMKGTVIALVRKFGKPERDNYEASC